jgi:hypothetical protein
MTRCVGPDDATKVQCTTMRACDGQLSRLPSSRHVYITILVQLPQTQALRLLDARGQLDLALFTVVVRVSISPTDTTSAATILACLLDADALEAEVPALVADYLDVSSLPLTLLELLLGLCAHLLLGALADTRRTLLARHVVDCILFDVDQLGQRYPLIGRQKSG